MSSSGLLPMPTLPKINLPPQQPLVDPTPQVQAPAQVAQQAPPQPQQALPAAPAPAQASYQDIALAALKAGRKPPPPPVGAILNGHRFAGGDFKAASAWIPLTGDDFIKTLDPTDVPVVKALAEGRMQIPGGFSAKSPYWIQKIQQVSQYDPTFDAATYPTRLKTRAAFTQGKEGQNLAAINTAISHLGQFGQKVNGVAGHSGFPFATTANSLINTFEQGTGDPSVTNYTADQAALAHELRRVFTVTGAGSEADLQSYLRQLSPDASKEQKVGTIREIVGLLAGRREALMQQYENGMGTDKYPIHFDTPHSNAVLNIWGPNGPDDPTSVPLDHAGTSVSGPAPIGRYPTPAPTPQNLPRRGSGRAAPQGIDPNIWGHMTPQEQSLWH